MSSTTLVSVQDYLATSYRPDRDFLDGELQERNLGELEHSRLQSAILAWFWTHRKEWNVLAAGRATGPGCTDSVSNSRRDGFAA